MSRACCGSQMGTLCVNGTGVGRGGLAAAATALLFLRAVASTAACSNPRLWGVLSTLPTMPTSTSHLAHAQRRGCIAVYGNSSLYGQNCTIKSCTVGWYGAGLLVYSGHASWAGGVFSNLHAHWQEGAGIYINDATLSMADSVILNGTATCGAAVTAEATSHVDMRRCIMRGCT